MEIDDDDEQTTPPPAWESGFMSNCDEKTTETTFHGERNGVVPSAMRARWP